MDTVLDGSEPDMSKLVCLRDSNGRPALIFGLLATVFFEQPWTRATRKAVAEAAEDYLRDLRDHLRWAKQPRTARLYPIDSGRVKSPGEWLPEHKEGESWFWGVPWRRPRHGYKRVSGERLRRQ